MTNYTTITVSAAQYSDADDCLAAASAEYLNDHPGVEDWQVTAEWASDERDEIALTVPAD